MASMDDHLEREEGPEERPRATFSDYVLGTVVAALFATSTVVAAILAFELGPAWPVAVDVAAIGGGSLLVRRVHDPALKAVAIGLIVGGLAAILLWPLFDVS